MADTWLALTPRTRQVPVGTAMSYPAIATAARQMGAAHPSALIHQFQRLKRDIGEVAGPEEPVLRAWRSAAGLWRRLMTSTDSRGEVVWGSSAVTPPDPERSRLVTPSDSGRGG